MVLRKDLTSFSCPTTLGESSILPGHAPLVAQLKSGELKAKNGSNEFNTFVSGGFVEVKADNQVIVLADAAEHDFEIDEQRAQEARARAQKELTEKKAGSQDYAAVAAALERSLARINIARKRASRNRPATGSEFNNQ